MIGIGNWEVTVNMLIYKGPIGVSIADNNGEYDVQFKMPDKFSAFKITTRDIVEEGNKLSGQGVVDMGKGRKIPVSAEVVIDGDVMTGTLNIPLMKREIPLKNGHRVD